MKEWIQLKVTNCCNIHLCTFILGLKRAAVHDSLFKKKPDLLVFPFMQTEHPQKPLPKKPKQKNHTHKHSARVGHNPPTMH